MSAIENRTKRDYFSGASRPCQSRVIDSWGGCPKESPNPLKVGAGSWTLLDSVDRKRAELELVGRDTAIERWDIEREPCARARLIGTHTVFDEVVAK